MDKVREMDISQIRLANLRAIAKQFVSDAAFAERLGRTPSQLSQVIGENPVRNIGSRFARSIEQTLSLKSGFLDRLHDDNEIFSSIGALPSRRKPSFDAYPKRAKMDRLMQLCERLPEYALDSILNQVTSTLEIIEKTREEIATESDKKVK